VANPFTGACYTGNSRYSPGHVIDEQSDTLKTDRYSNPEYLGWNGFKNYSEVVMDYISF